MPGWRRELPSIFKTLSCQVDRLEVGEVDKAALGG